MSVNFVTEGMIDGVVAQKMLDAVGLKPGTHYPCGGKSGVDRRIAKYNSAARNIPWFVLRDQNSAPCPGGIVANLVPQLAPLLCFRIVPHAIEAWLMGDRSAFANFFRVRVAQVPTEPELVPNPKRTLVDVIRHSSKPEIIKDMTPRPASGTTVGPNYESVLTEFVCEHWDLHKAKIICPALDRALTRLSELRARP